MMVTVVRVVLKILARRNFFGALFLGTVHHRRNVLDRPTGARQVGNVHADPIVFGIAIAINFGI